LAGPLDYARAAKLDLELRTSWRQRLRRGDGSVRMVEDLLRSRDVALDIGASWGHYTSAMARLVGDGGSVHAFEPNPANARQLSLIALRHLNVTVHPIGLSDAAGEAELHVPVRGGRPITERGSLGPIDVETKKVPIVLERLDDVIEPEIQVAFLKCDVEGHERGVFEGGARLLERSRPVILVEIERRHAHSDVLGTIALLESMDYDAYMVSGEELIPASHFDPEIHQPVIGVAGSAERLPAGYVGDFLFLPPSRTRGSRT
jgi:FkbM family methyltransferase